jgi:hypothetical protein
VQQTKALGTLTGYAFITEHQQTAPGSNKERLFDMHRLVHMALIWWLEGHGEREKWANIAVARVEELVPYGGHEGNGVWRAYLPHASKPQASLKSTCLLTTVNDTSALEKRLHDTKSYLGKYSERKLHIFLVGFFPFRG